MHRNRIPFHLTGIATLAVLSWASLVAPKAHAVEGTELNSSLGLWAPLLPELRDDSGDSIGTVLSLSGHHRFAGFLTNVESGVTYGVTDSAEMFGFEMLLRDTWTLGDHELSAGFGYSQMNWEQEDGQHFLDSDFHGAKIVGGWQTLFGRRPVWLDMSLGLYDMNGGYLGEDGVGGDNVAETDEFATVFGFEWKTDVTCCGVPARTVFGLDYISDITTWQDGHIGTDDAVVLTGALELRLY